MISVALAAVQDRVSLDGAAGGGVRLTEQIVRQGDGGLHIYGAAYYGAAYHGAAEKTVPQPAPPTCVVP